jgi:hypothetical protein
MATSTTRLGLRKPDPDPVTGDDVDVQADLNDNYDKIDGVVSATVCTSGTRPTTTAFIGQIIFETDTAFLYICTAAGPVWRRVTMENSTGDIVVTGQLKAENNTQRSKAYLSAQTTLANSTAETMIAQFTIAASEAIVGAAWRLRAWGLFGVTGTPTLTFRTRLGGTGGSSNASSGAQTIQSGVTNRLWASEQTLVCTSTGISANWYSQFYVRMSGVLAGAAPFINDGAELTSIMDGTSVMVESSVASKAFGLSAQWSAASASNSITCQGFLAERIA